MAVRKTYGIETRQDALDVLGLSEHDSRGISSASLIAQARQVAEMLKGE